MKKAIYAGSFDPMHQGHIAIIKKAISLFDFIYVVVATNPHKNSSNINERKEYAIKKLANIDNVKVLVLEQEYLANLAKDMNINFLIRSARDGNDFLYELSMAHQNKEINHNLETILIIPNKNDLEYRSSDYKKTTK